MIFKFIKIWQPWRWPLPTSTGMSTSLKVKRNPRSQGQTNSTKRPKCCSNLYIVRVQFINRQLNYWFSQDTVYNKSPPRIGEGRIIKGPAMATFCRDRQLSTDYGNDQFRHAILNKASWVMRFSSKWLVFKVPFLH